MSNHIDLIEIGKFQAKLIKNSLCFSKCHRSTASLKAMQIKPVSRKILVNSIKLLRTMYTNLTIDQGNFTNMQAKDVCAEDKNLYICCRKFSEWQNNYIPHKCFS